MRYSDLQIVFQEIPNEISLAIHVTGCPLKCAGCHSSIYWNPHIGQDLTIDHLCELLHRYEKYITCVLFLGGEWDTDYLLKLLKSMSFDTKDSRKIICEYFSKKFEVKIKGSNAESCWEPDSDW